MSSSSHLPILNSESTKFFHNFFFYKGEVFNCDQNKQNIADDITILQKKMQFAALTKKNLENNNWLIHNSGLVVDM